MMPQKRSNLKTAVSIASCRSSSVEKHLPAASCSDGNISTLVQRPNHKRGLQSRFVRVAQTEAALRPDDDDGSSEVAPHTASVDISEFSSWSLNSNWGIFRKHKVFLPISSV